RREHRHRTVTLYPAVVRCATHSHPVARDAQPPLERMGRSGDNDRMTTILTVRHQGKVALGGDGQVTLGNTVMKADANKIRKLTGENVLCGFAGSSADAFALLDR